MNSHYQELVETAVAALDKVMGEHPDKTNDELSQASQCLSHLRDHLIEEKRAGRRVDGRLNKVNAIISAVIASEYPLVGVRWDRIKMARGALVELLEEGQL